MESDITAFAPTALRIGFFVLMILFMVYGAFLGYHWFTFGDDRRTSTIALATYLLGGAILFLTLIASIRMI